jgi:hypothetical protein
MNECLVFVLWAFFCVYVQVEALRRADHPSKGPTDCPSSSNWSETESFMEAAKAWTGL